MKVVVWHGEARTIYYVVTSTVDDFDVLASFHCEDKARQWIGSRTTGTGSLNRRRLMRYQLVKYGRFWAVFDGSELVCVTVYRKGGREVIRRLLQLDTKEIA